MRVMIPRRSPVMRRVTDRKEIGWAGTQEPLALLAVEQIPEKKLVLCYKSKILWIFTS